MLLITDRRMKNIDYRGNSGTLTWGTEYLIDNKEDIILDSAFCILRDVTSDSWD